MMRKLLLFILILGIPGVAASQTPQVPSEMQFADIKLEITDAARREIQTHVDALYRSEKYFNIKLDRVDLYFPIIEKVFREENLPDDFKYLVIQESALISDAVSSSNAVGFWQFKKASAEEVGLRIDGAVDERLNIVSSSGAAARYLKRNNNYFGNWLYALLSYNTGAGGAQKIVDDEYFGAKKMKIDKRTHWYIIKFLAHKIAFETAIGKNTKPSLRLIEYTGAADKSLKQIALETRIDASLLEEYNKWLKRGNVPDDKVYSVIIPATYSDVENIVAIDYNNGNTTDALSENYAKQETTLSTRFSKGSDQYPIIEGEIQKATKESVLVMVNGKPGIIAGPDNNLLELAELGGISISRFLKFNDLDSDDRAQQGQVYYLKAKRGRAAEHYHVVSEADNLWSISQKYGIKQKKILQKNRMEKGEQLKPGRVLWMRFVRPKDEPVAYRDISESESIAKNSNNNTVNIPVGENALTQDLPSVRNVKNEMRAENKDTSHLRGTSAEISQPAKEINQPAVSQNSDNIETYPEIISGDDGEDEDAFTTTDEVKFVEAEAAPETSTADSGDVHRVKKGETLYGIARLYNIQVGEILLWNNLSLRDELKIDQILKISAPEARENPVKEDPVMKQEEFIIHEVASGETMYKIARDHNVTIKDVMQWNGKNDFRVSIGEKLKIKKASN